MKFNFVVACFFLLIGGCKTLDELPAVVDLRELGEQMKNSPEDVKKIHQQVKKTQRSLKKQVGSARQLFSVLHKAVERKWGKKNTERASNKKYVKYSNDYKARTIIDFEKSRVEVETIASQDTRALLIKAITTTLLTSSDPNKTDIFSSADPILGDEPFLYKQVLDQDNLPIRYLWRANRFSEYLVNNKLVKDKRDGHIIYSVQFDLVENNAHLRKIQFSDYVLAASKKYNIPASLIYGVIETESSFNPYAVSSANAYGLMQVIPATAGRDVYQRIKKVSGQPSKNTLFNPQYNIDIGSAYLSILRDNYLHKITTLDNRHYAIISSYNGGAGNVLRIFSQDRDQAFRQINSLSASMFYQILTTKHPKLESRNYLKKVTKAEMKYQP